MRKSRIKLTDLSQEVFVSLNSSPNSFFNKTDDLSIQVPSWAQFTLVVLFPESTILDVSFFEDAKDFFVSYTKKAIRRSHRTSDFACFNKEDGNWKSFLPPTLIGTNLETRLRKSSSDE